MNPIQTAWTHLYRLPRYPLYTKRSCGTNWQQQAIHITGMMPSIVREGILWTWATTELPSLLTLLVMTLVTCRHLLKTKGSPNRGVLLLLCAMPARSDGSPIPNRACEAERSEERLLSGTVPISATDSLSPPHGG